MPPQFYSRRTDQGWTYSQRQQSLRGGELVDLRQLGQLVVRLTVNRVFEHSASIGGLLLHH